MRKRIFFKLLAAFVLVIMAATLTLDFSVRRAWERSLTSEIERNLNQKTLLFAHRVEIDHEHSLQDIASQEGQAAGARATIIDHEGNVLADSPEVATARSSPVNAVRAGAPRPSSREATRVKVVSTAGWDDGHEAPFGRAILLLKI